MKDKQKKSWDVGITLLYVLNFVIVILLFIVILLVTNHSNSYLLKLIKLLDL